MNRRSTNWMKIPNTTLTVSVRTHNNTTTSSDTNPSKLEIESMIASNTSKHNSNQYKYTSSLHPHHSNVLLRKDRGQSKKFPCCFVLLRSFVVLLLLTTISILYYYYYYYYNGLDDILQQQRNYLHSVILSSNHFTKQQRKNDSIVKTNRKDSNNNNGMKSSKKRRSSVLKLPTSNNNQQQQQHDQTQKEEIRSNVDGTSSTKQDESLYYFNSLPIHKMDPNRVVSLQSSVDCISHQHPIYDSTTTKMDSSSQWISRSCYYRNLCYDTFNEDYVLVNLPKQQQQQQYDGIDVSIGSINPRWNIVPLEQLRKRRKKTFVRDPTILNQTIINITTSDRGVYKMKWKPRIISTSTTTTTANANYFYELPSNVLLLPFHSMAGHNVGHLLWDDLYPLYSLLKKFGYRMSTSTVSNNNNNDESSIQKQQLLLLRMKLKDYVPLYATCDIQRNKRIGCNDNYHKWLPLLNVNPQTFSSTKTINITSNDGRTTATSQNVRYVCANKALAGIGMLNDHGWDDHGWDSIPTKATTTTITGTDSVTSTVPRYIHNLGRGNQFYQFCQLLIRNGAQSTTNDDLGNTVSTAKQQPKLRRSEGMDMLQNSELNKADNGNDKDTIRITFSINSSRDWTRRTNFTTYIEALQERFDTANDNTKRSSTIQINVYEFRTLQLHEQIQIMQQTDIFISVGGGGTISSMFLRRNAVVVLFYSVSGGYDFYTNHATNQSILLDYDLFSNISHLRIHWFPLLFETITATTTTSRSLLEQKIYNNHIQLFVQLIHHEIVSIRHRKAILNRISNT